MNQYLYSNTAAQAHASDLENVQDFPYTPQTAPRGFKGVWIPSDVYLDQRLSAVEKFILIEIHSLCQLDGCHASRAYLANFCQVSEATIKRAVAHLIELGYVWVKSFDGRRRVLGCTLQPQKYESYPQVTRLSGQNDPAPGSKRPTSKNRENKYKKKGAPGQADTSAPPPTGATTPKKGAPTPKRPKASKVEDLRKLIAERVEDPELANALGDHLQILIEKRKTPTVTGFTRKIDSILEIQDPRQRLACVRYSVTNGYQGLFPERFKGNPQGNSFSARRGAPTPIPSYPADMPTRLQQCGVKTWGHFHFLKFKLHDPIADGVDCRCGECKPDDR